MSAGDITKGRRVASVNELKRPGDYCGPLIGYTGDMEAVFFIKPNVPDDQAHGRIHHVLSPPHRFRECPDGSLEIRESISDRTRGQDPSTPGDGWHGYLDEGHIWRQV
jgi:hypothetical protein